MNIGTGTLAAPFRSRPNDANVKIDLRSRRFQQPNRYHEPTYANCLINKLTGTRSNHGKSFRITSNFNNIRFATRFRGPVAYCKRLPTSTYFANTRYSATAPFENRNDQISHTNSQRSSNLLHPRLRGWRELPTNSSIFRSHAVRGEDAANFTAVSLLRLLEIFFCYGKFRY